MHSMPPDLSVPMSLTTVCGSSSLLAQAPAVYHHCFAPRVFWQFKREDFGADPFISMTLTLAIIGGAVVAAPPRNPHCMPVPQNGLCPVRGRGIAVVLSEGVLAHGSVAGRLSTGTGTDDGDAAEDTVRLIRESCRVEQRCKRLIGVAIPEYQGPEARDSEWRSTI
jgi:hypothetical protein